MIYIYTSSFLLDELQSLLKLDEKQLTLEEIKLHEQQGVCFEDENEQQEELLDDELNDGQLEE